MGLLSTVVDQVVGDESSDEADAETFSYRCAQCGASFEREKTRMIGVSCPDCGSRDVRADE